MIFIQIQIYFSPISNKYMYTWCTVDCMFQYNWHSNKVYTIVIEFYKQKVPAFF